jgi:cellulose synthase/poly-beta-1,6-N-acetylglucosamine synthase-like glycosyltransferase
MSQTRARRLKLVAAVVGISIGAAWLRVVHDVLQLDLLLYGIASFLFCIDIVDATVRWRCVRHLARRDAAADTLDASDSLPLRPYALVFSVRNLTDSLDEFIEATTPYRDRTWIIDDASTDGTALRLRAAGWRCIESAVNLKKPAALKALLRHLPADVHTVIVMDPDTHIQSGRVELERVLCEFQSSTFAALCPRIVLRPDGWLVSAQELEYALACCLGRKSLGDESVTSGAAVYRRDALERALARHSLSVYAEDFENTLLLLGAGERIRYDDRLQFCTDGKRSLPGWFSQRVGWSFGLMRVCSQRREALWQAARRSPMSFYQYIVYCGGFTLLGAPAKLFSAALLVTSFVGGLDQLLGLGWVPVTAATQPMLFATVCLKHLLLLSIVILLALPARERARALLIAPVYFFYSLLHLLPMSLGYLNWIAMRACGRRLYRDHYSGRTPAASAMDGLRA